MTKLTSSTFLAIVLPVPVPLPVAPVSLPVARSRVVATVFVGVAGGVSRRRVAQVVGAGVVEVTCARDA